MTPGKSEDSVADWLERLRGGSQGTAVQRLWERYYRQLVTRAEGILRNRPRAAADGEDVALSAFASLVIAVRDGRYPQLADGDGFCAFLWKVVHHKAINLITRDSAAKRGGGRVAHFSALEAAAAGVDPPATGSDESAEAAAVVEAMAELLRHVPEDLHQIAFLKLEGQENQAIAIQIGKSVATVERKLRHIREKLEATGLWPEATARTSRSQSSPKSLDGES